MAAARASHAHRTLRLLSRFLVIVLLMGTALATAFASPTDHKTLRVRGRVLD
jgi:hypothetical protein